MKFSIKEFFSKLTNPQETVDLVKFTEEILNGKLHFLCSELIETWNLKKLENIEKFTKLRELKV